MGLKINRQTNLNKLFDEFAIDPTKEANNAPKDPKKKNQDDKDKKIFHQKNKVN